MNGYELGKDWQNRWSWADVWKPWVWDSCECCLEINSKQQKQRSEKSVHQQISVWSLGLSIIFFRWRLDATDCNLYVSIFLLLPLKFVELWRKHPVMNTGAGHKENYVMWSRGIGLKSNMWHFQVFYLIEVLIRRGTVCWKPYLNRTSFSKVLAIERFSKQ